MACLLRVITDEHRCERLLCLTELRCAVVAVFIVVASCEYRCPLSITVVLVLGNQHVLSQRRKRCVCLAAEFERSYSHFLSFMHLL